MAAVLREIRQGKGFESRGEEAVVTLLRTADRVRSAIAQTVAQAGLTEQQYNVLRILRGAGPGGLPTLEIASRMIERCPGVTRLVDRLVASSLVLRGPGDADRRQVVCRITARGTTLLARFDRPVRATAERCMTPLGPDGLDALVRLLDATRAAAEAPALESTRRFRRKQGETR